MPGIEKGRIKYVMDSIVMLRCHIPHVDCKPFFDRSSASSFCKHFICEIGKREGIHIDEILLSHPEVFSWKETKEYLRN